MVRRLRALRRLPADRVVPWGTALSLFVLLYTLSLLRAHTLLGGYDLGYFRQASWLVSEGKEPFVTIRGLHLLADHAYFVFYPMAWLTKALSTIPTLLGIQAAALAVAVVPLYVICRRLAGLGVAASALVLAAYAAYPAMHNVNLTDFHPETIAVPALLGAALFGLTGRWWPYGVCLAVVLLAREDLAVPAATLGLLLVIEGRRRAGLLTVAVAVGWFLLDVKVVQPHFADGEFVQGALRLPQYGDDLFEIVRTMVTHPGRVVGDLWTPQNFEVVIALFAPLLFLPLLAPRYLLPGLPLQALYLMSNQGAAHTIDNQYTVGIIGFAFLATAMALGTALRRRDTLPGRLWLLLPLASAAFFVQLSNSSPFEHPWDWRHRDAVDQARLSAADLVPPDADLSASQRMWQLVADRENLYNFPMPWRLYGNAPGDDVPLLRRRSDVRWLLIDTADRGQWTDDDQKFLDALAPSLGFTLVSSDHGILVYRRPELG